MKINHINFGVTDVPATVAMFKTYFGLRLVEGFPETPKMAFMNDDDNSLIAVFKVNDAVYPKMFHIGFIQKSVDHVREIHAKLKAGGLNPEEPREEHGRLTFYFQSPGGFTVEVDAFF